MTPPAKPERGAAPARAASSSGVSQAGSGFAVQVTALRTKQDAEAMVRALRGRGYPVLLVSPGHAHAKDSLYRVQVGPYASRNDAERARAKLTQQGFRPFIRH
jgi:cell division septation protein DedD